jgi:TDG/mug DNA glycosylase family protein
MIQSFAPIIDENCKTLILGSMPGVKSLQENQYYAHPRNSFWPIVYTLFEEPYEQSYPKRTQFLLGQQIALWDVLKKCEREGSLDTAIQKEEVNDFQTLFKAYPNIQRVFLNGTKAYETFRKKVGFDFEGITFYKLPSTSPAHAVAFEKKLEAWKAVIS